MKNDSDKGKEKSRGDEFDTWSSGSGQGHSKTGGDSINSAGET